LVALASAPVPGPRVAFAVGRTVGNAVIRNRLRRRLRVALGLLADQERLTADAYLVIAAPPAATASVRELEEALASALDRLEEMLGR
jgi:ribonuclease P protein component